MAVGLGESELAGLLLARGADPNDRLRTATPLLAAVVAGSPTLVG